MTRARMRALVAGLCLLVAPAASFADPITDWNARAVAAVALGRGGPPGLMDLALVHLAMHDAVQAIEGKYQPYHYADPAALGSGSPAAAASAAAYRVLWLLYESQRAGLDTFYATYIATNGLAGDPGLDIGMAAGSALYADHYRKPLVLTPYHGVDAIGQWYSPVTPFGFLELASQRPFALNRIDQFRPEPPPPMVSVTYLRDYNEVKATGQNTSPPNGDDRDKAWFWSVNFPGQYNQCARQLAAEHLTAIGDSARLFALINTAMADAAMAVWDSKYFYNFWRPVPAIRQGDSDPNARTEGVAEWSSLLGSPAYPDYVSGANGLTGAWTGMMRSFLGSDSMELDVSSSSPNTTTPVRHFSSFSQVADEVVDARVLLGIHFRFADEEGRRLGERVAHWTFQQLLRPVPGSH